MKISEVIREIKSLYEGHSYLGINFDEHSTRDKVLYGNDRLDDACTGVVTTCWANISVILKAVELGANLIVVHEALFWNHGDHQDWLIDNRTYRKKKALLDKHGIAVWRNHDFIHSGMRRSDGTYVDGIFYGLIRRLGWENSLNGWKNYPMIFRFEHPKTLSELANELIEKTGGNGARVVGEDDMMIRSLAIGLHAMGPDNALIELLERDEIDALLLLEMVDFSVVEFANDCILLGRNKAIISVGHFNLEEPGMEYLCDFIKTEIRPEFPVYFVPGGDTIRYLEGKSCD